ncbi:MAG: PIN domain-containing protein [Janthinobacterium lividum]
MGQSAFTVLYDANVLYPAPLRNFLMHLALTGVYRAHWSGQIQEEWKRNLLINRPELNREQLNRTSLLMDLALPDALVIGYEPLIEQVQLPDINDRHVLAAAIKSNATSIITFNLKDFPSVYLQPYDIEALHPDDFIVLVWNLNRTAVVEAARRQRASLEKPASECARILEHFAGAEAFSNSETAFAIFSHDLMYSFKKFCLQVN